MLCIPSTILSYDNNIMITAKIILQPVHILYSSTSFGDTMHLVGNNSSMQPIPLWSMGKSIFLHDVNL